MKGMSKAQARLVAADLPAIEEALKERGPASTWGGRCHEISLALLRTGLFGPGRVARGWAEDVTGQHSWIVLGDDVYSPNAVVVDPTRWGYGKGEHTPVVEVSRNLLLHHPHGEGNIFAYGAPDSHEEGYVPEGKLIELPNYAELSPIARQFLDMCGYPMDRKNWAFLAHAPMGGWPSGEIISAMCEVPELAVIVPIDVVGHVTDRNPNGLYR